MPRFLVLFVVLAVVFWVITVVDCAMQPATRHRGLSKRVWVFVVILLPVAGGILWFLLGRSRASAAAFGQRAPDDDPDFLRSIRIDKEQAERISRLEEELRLLDDEQTSDDGDDNDPRDDDSRDQHGAQS